MTQSKQTYKADFIEKFGVPEVALPAIDIIVTPIEQRMIADLGGDVFNGEDAVRSFAILLGFNPSGAEAVEFLEDSYRRGIFELHEDTGDYITSRYTIGSFYDRLDIFVITENDEWRALPKTDREAIENWYFDTFYEGLDWDTDDGRPREEEILPIEEALSRIEEFYSSGKELYLTECDCRMLRGECGAPTLVCLNSYNGPNSHPDRGISQPVTIEEAKAVTLAADRAGLVHTFNPWGLCNCCSDCCYNYRARARKDSGAVFPLSRYVIAYDEDKCIGCGVCLGRCRFGVFDKSDFDKDGKAAADTSLCIGCGVCRSTCPTDALVLEKR